MSWQTNYDNMEPKTEHEARIEKIRLLRYELDIDYDSHYQLEELEQMALERLETAQN